MNMQTQHNDERMRERFKVAQVRVRQITQERLQRADQEAATEALPEMLRMLIDQDECPGPFHEDTFGVAVVTNVTRLADTKYTSELQAHQTCCMVTVDYQRELEFRGHGKRWVTLRAIFGLETATGRVACWEN